MRAGIIQSVERPNRNKKVKRGLILFLLELWHLSSPALGHWSSCFSGLQTPGLNASVLLVLKPLAGISEHRDILLTSLELQLADGRLWHISGPIIMWANSHNKSHCIYLFLYLLLVLFLLQLLSLFSHLVMSDSLWPHGLQHDRLPCPSPSPRVFSNSCPSSRWCYLTILSSATIFSFCFNLSQHHYEQS